MSQQEYTLEISQNDTSISESEKLDDDIYEEFFLKIPGFYETNLRGGCIEKGYIYIYIYINISI